MVLREMTLLFSHPKTLLCCWSHFPSRLQLSLATPALLMHPYHSVPRAEIPVRLVFGSQESKNLCVSTPFCSDPTETKAATTCTDRVYPLQSPHSLTSRSQSTMACSYLPPCLFPRYHYGWYPKPCKSCCFIHLNKSTLVFFSRK